MRTSVKVISILGLVAASFLPMHAEDEKGLEETLRSQLEGKIVTLRGFPRGENVRYDAGGNLVGKADKGVWSLEGRMEVTKVQIERHRCVLVGNRLATMFDNEKKETKYLRAYPSKVEIEMTESDTGAALRTALGNVLLRPGEKLTEQAPSYWRYFLENPFAAGAAAAKDPSGASIRKTEESKSGWTESAPMGVPQERPLEGDVREPDYYAEDGTPVFRATGQDTPLFYSRKKKITAPKVLYSPDPVYPDAMRKHGIQGTSIFWVIVGADGKVKEMQVIRPLGMGFDDAAADAISKWKFAPAKIEGKPVAVRINIEVNFRI